MLQTFTVPPTRTPRKPARAFRSTEALIGKRALSSVPVFLSRRRSTGNGSEVMTVLEPSGLGRW